MACPDDETLLKFAGGELAPAEQAALAAHLDGCATCRALAGWALRSGSTGGAGWRGLLEPLAPLLPGATVGRYVVLDKLGAGAMGAVYLAHDPQIDRKVALKLVRAGLTSGAPEELQERLKREARALGRLSHRNVVGVHDVGALAARGEIFFAMEYVEGETLSSWLRREPRSPRAVLAIFLQAGEGLAAAHAVGMVHRDFKPDNVLVGSDGVAHVSDFGLARLLEEGPGEPTLPSPTSEPIDAITRSGQFVGSPAFAAPEQLQGLPADPRADIFSFCVALHLALTGERPFAGNSARALLEAIEAGQLSPPPSGKRIPARVRRALARGLQAAPEKRWPSMAALLAELRDDAGARARKLAFGGAVAAVLVLSVALALVWQQRRAALCAGGEAQLDEALGPQRMAEIEKDFQAAAPSFAAQSWRLVEGSLRSYRAGWAAMHRDSCEATRLRGEQSEELLDLRAQCLEQRRRELRAAGELLAGADAALVARAPGMVSSLPPVALCADAAALREPQRIPADPAARAGVDEARTLDARAYALRLAGRPREAAPLAEQAVAKARELRYPPLLADGLIVLSDIRFDAGDAPGALTAALDASTAALESGAEKAAAGALSLATRFLGARGDYAAAHADGRIARALALHLGDERAEASLDYFEGDVYRSEGKYDEADKLLLRALEIRRRLPNTVRAQVCDSLSALGELRQVQGRLDESIALLREAVAVAEEATGVDNPLNAFALNNLANSLQIKGGHDAEVESIYRRVIALRLAALGPDSTLTAVAWANLSMQLAHTGRAEEALPMVKRALEVKRKVLGPENPSVAFTLMALAEVETLAGDNAAAIAAAREAQAIRTKALGPEHELTAEALGVIGAALLAEGKPAEAVPALEQAAAVYERKVGTAHYGLFEPLTALGAARLAMHAPEKARADLEKAVAVGIAAQLDPVKLADARLGLARAEWESGHDRKRARSLAAEALADDEKGGAAGAKQAAEAAAWLKAHPGG